MTNKIALITGASRGLGRSMALHLAKNGTDIIGTYRSSADEGAKVAAEIEAMGVKAAMLAFDANAEDYSKFAQEVTQVLKAKFDAEHLHYVVNNAGVGAHAAFLETTPEQLDELYRIHVRAPFFLTQALVPSIAEGGSVLFVSSGLTRFSLPGYSAYASMKGAIEVLTRYAAKELGERNIRVNCLAPGAIETDFGGGAVRDSPELNQIIASTTALGRVGLPDDVGGAAAALLSEGMRWMNGERVEVSGGQSL